MTFDSGQEIRDSRREFIRFVEIACERLAKASSGCASAPLRDLQLRHRWRHSRTL
jgi:hypothetical protein